MTDSVSSYLIITLVGLGVLAIIALILRYPGTLTGGLQVFNAFKIWFSGSKNAPTATDAPTASPIIEGDPTIIAGDLVAGNKVINIQSLRPSLALQTPTPELFLRVFRRDSAWVHSQAIVVNPNPRGEFDFGFALHNDTPSAPASNVRITVELFWEGSDIKEVPKFSTREMASGWTSNRRSINSELPAVFAFHGPTYTAFPSQPEEWPSFTGFIEPGAAGRFILSYVVSSASPPSESKGRLTIEIA